jgi:transposase
MGRHKRRHNKSFREEACKLVTEQGYSVREAARELGMAHHTLWNWLTECGQHPLNAQERDKQLGDDPKVLRIRIKELEQRVRQLETEKQILKKATAFFAQEQQT